MIRDMNDNGTDNNPVTHFAITNYRDIHTVFGIKEKDRRGHMYVIGKTGTGKSTLIENMIISDISGQPPPIFTFSHSRAVLPRR